MIRLREIWNRYREIVTYLIFGVLTTLVNYVILWFIYDLCGLRAGDGRVANGLAWVGAVLFAYVTNKTLVFQSRRRDRKTLLRETGTFFGSRLVTLGVETLLLYLGLTLPAKLIWDQPSFEALRTMIKTPETLPDWQLSLWFWGIKIGASAVTVIGNYVFSKLLIFRKDPAEK